MDLNYDHPKTNTNVTETPSLILLDYKNVVTNKWKKLKRIIKELSKYKSSERI